MLVTFRFFSNRLCFGPKRGNFDGLSVFCWARWFRLILCSGRELCRYVEPYVQNQITPSLFELTKYTADKVGIIIGVWSFVAYGGLVLGV